MVNYIFCIRVPVVIEVLNIVWFFTRCCKEQKEEESKKQKASWKLYMDDIQTPSWAKKSAAYRFAMCMARVPTKGEAHAN